MFWVQACSECCNFERRCLEVYALFREDIKGEVPSGKGEGGEGRGTNSCCACHFGPMAANVSVPQVPYVCLLKRCTWLFRATFLCGTVSSKGFHWGQTQHQHIPTSWTHMDPYGSLICFPSCLLYIARACGTQQSCLRQRNELCQKQVFGNGCWRDAWLSSIWMLEGAPSAVGS